MAEITYTPRLSGPYLIERGRSQVIQLPLYSGAALAVPTASGSTCAIRDAAGAVVATGAITVSSSIATYSISGTATEGQTLGERWKVAWSLVMPDGVTHAYEQPAALCRVVPSPAACEADLYQRAPALDPLGPAPVSATGSWQPQLDEAWAQIGQRLTAAGRRPWLVVGSVDLRQPHIVLALALCYEALASRLNPSFLELAKVYRSEYNAAWSALSLSYDSSDDGVIDLGRASSGTLMLCSRGGSGIPVRRWPF